MNLFHCQGQAQATTTMPTGPQTPPHPHPMGATTVVVEVELSPHRPEDLVEAREATMAAMSLPAMAAARRAPAAAPQAMIHNRRRRRLVNCLFQTQEQRQPGCLGPLLRHICRLR